MRIEKQGLLKAVEVAINGCRAVSGQLIGDVSSFLFKNGHIYSWSLVIAVQMRLPDDCRELTGVVTGQDLLTLLQKIKSQIIDIDCKSDSWTISSDVVTATIACKNDNISAAIRDLNAEVLEWSPLPKRFYDCLRVTNIPANNTKSAGTFFYKNMMYATDGIRCIAADMDGNIDEPTLISLHSVSNLLSLNQQFNEISVGKSWVNFRYVDKNDNASAIFSCSRMREDVWFPRMLKNVTELFNNADKTKDSPHGELPDLSEAVNVASIFSTVFANASNVICITMNNNYIIVESQREKAGTVKNKVPWEKGKAPELADSIRFQISANMLLEMTKYTNEFYLSQNGKRLLIVFEGKFYKAVMLTIVV